MKRNIFLTIAIALCSCICSAQYSVLNVSGNVKIKKGMNFQPLAKGSPLTAGDVLELAEGASVEIFNSTNSQSYTCDKPGVTSVSGIMIRATTLASDKGKSIRDNLNFSRSSASGTGHVYVESGMVKRSMATYDPEAKNIEVDPKTLSRYVINALRNPSSMTNSECPTTFSHDTNPDGGLGFSIGNTLKTPVYFNVIKVAEDSIASISISELGQPSGSYVLLPSQTISREQLSPMKTGERHILIMTHFNFDVDKLIEQIEMIVNSDEIITADNSINVYISPL